MCKLIWIVCQMHKHEISKSACRVFIKKRDEKNPEKIDYDKIKV